MRAKSSGTKRFSTKADHDLPQLTGAMLKRGAFKRGGKVVPRAAGTAEFKRAIGRPKSANPKQLLTLRLPPDVIASWKATGPGWQTRMAEKLTRVA